MIRQILVTVAGHVDHGKSSILDRIRSTSIVDKEAGKITQAIGASVIPIETIKRVCGSLLDTLKFDITVPGLLAIDTPGHAAFTNLRKRGGSLADIAIVVIDINEGFRPQTIETIEILKKHKTPFVIAANKLDLLPGWKSDKAPVLQSLTKQSPATQELFEKRMYELVGSIYEKFQIQAERFDRVSDYTQQIAIVPTSANTGEGIPELLMVLVGLAQKYLEKRLHADECGAAKGTVMEIKEDKGLGKTMDAILYDGCLRVNDYIVIGGIGEPIVTKVKALFTPSPLAEMRDKGTKFKSVKEIIAAAGVKVVAKDIHDVVSGMPFMSVHDKDIEEVKKEIQNQVQEVTIETDCEGLVVKADSLGSLEALIVLLKEKNIPIRHAMVGDISKKDISDAETNTNTNPLFAAVLGFNIKLREGVNPGHVKILTNNIIYRLIEDYENWCELEKKKIQEKKLSILTRPFKIQILTGYVFRQSNPAVAGVEIMAGTARTGTGLMNPDGQLISSVKGIQVEQENVSSAERGKQVAVSMPSIIIGRHVKEGDVLYSHIPEDDFRKLKEFKEYLTDDERETLREIAKIMRKDNPVWGV